MTRAAILAACALFVLPLAASAHATGVSYQTDSGPYTIDVGYSSPAPQAGDSVLFDFKLRKGTDDVPFADAWVKIENASGAVAFASGIHNNPFGGSRMSYAFAKAGAYVVDVRYETDTASIVESSFPITVLPATAAWYADARVWLAALVVLEALTLGALAYALRRRARP